MVCSGRRWNGDLVLARISSFKGEVGIEVFLHALSQWENKVYVEKNFVEWPMCTNAELLLDIVRSFTW